MSWRRIWAMVIRHLYIWPRTLDRLMWAFGWPFLDLFIWGLVSAYFQKTSQAEFSLINMLLGGVIFWTMFWRAQNEVSVNFLDEGWNKNLISLFATPLTWGEFLMATIILGLIKLVFTMASVTLAALFFYPLTALPAWVQKISLFLPSTYVFEEMRRVLFTGQADSRQLFIAFGLNCFYLVLALKFFQWMYVNARIHGRLIKLN